MVLERYSCKHHALQKDPDQQVAEEHGEPDSYEDFPFEVIQVYKLRRLLSCLQTTYKLSIKYLQVCQVLYVWIT